MSARVAEKSPIAMVALHDVLRPASSAHLAERARGDRFWDCRDSVGPKRRRSLDGPARTLSNRSGPRARMSAVAPIQRDRLYPGPLEFPSWSIFCICRPVIREKWLEAGTRFIMWQLCRTKNAALQGVHYVTRVEIAASISTPHIARRARDGTR